MTLHLNLSERTEMIAIGAAVGAFIRSAARQKPCFVAVEGPLECGKSLIPLAIDRHFRPAAYRRGIHHKRKADNLTSGPVVFINSFYAHKTEKFELDKALEQFQKDTPGAEVYIASNILKNQSESYKFRIYKFNAEALGKKSDILDMAINIQWTVHPAKHMSITLREPSLEESLGQYLPNAHLC